LHAGAVEPDHESLKRQRPRTLPFFLPRVLCRLVVSSCGKGRSPQGLKPLLILGPYGAAEAAPFQNCSLAEGVSDRRAYAKHVGGVESLIALDVVVVSLGTHEDVGQAVPDVVAEAGADVFHEMIAAGEVDASRAATGIEDVEPVAGNADAGHEVEAHFLVDLGLKEQVGVGEKRAVIFVTVIAPLLVPPGSFDVDAQMMLEGNDVTGEAEVESSRFCQRLEGDYVAGGGE
jgi:hypothetical protein